jgi:hypothetical protein
MTSPTRLRRLTGIAVAAIGAALGFGATTFAPTSAEAGVFVSFGFGFPGGFPGYYYPPFPYYPPPPPYFPPLGEFQTLLPAAPPSAGYPPPGGHSATGSAATPSITYTRRPGWTNAAGQYCREYKSNQGVGNRATERYGTACRDASGQWRIVN